MYVLNCVQVIYFLLFTPAGFVQLGSFLKPVQIRFIRRKRQRTFTPSVAPHIFHNYRGRVITLLESAALGIRGTLQHDDGTYSCYRNPLKTTGVRLLWTYRFYLFKQIARVHVLLKFQAGYVDTNRQLISLNLQPEI